MQAVSWTPDLASARGSPRRSGRWRRCSGRGTHSPTGAGACSAVHPGSAAAAPCRPCGSEFSRPCVYGCDGWSNSGSTLATLDRTAGVHHLHAVGDAGHDAEVVGDQHDGGAEVATDALRSPRGSAPAPSRRAPSWARRRSAPSGRWRSPSRSSRAGACRPRTRAGTGAHAAWAAGCRRCRAARRPGSLASSLEIDWCAWSISTIWAPTRCTGFSADSGSWKIIAISPPRALRSTFGEAPTSSMSFTVAEPVMRADLGSRPMTARNDTDLPEPDSPTTPTTSPGATSRLTPRTACTSPSRVLKRDPEVLDGQCVRRSLGIHLHLGIDGVAHAVTDEVDAQRDDDQQHTGVHRPATSTRRAPPSWNHG